MKVAVQSPPPTIRMGDTLFQIIGGVLYCTSIVCTDVFFSYFKVNAELNMIEKKGHVNIKWSANTSPQF